MAQFGNTSPSMSPYVVVSATLYQCQVVIPPADGKITSVSIYCRDDAMSMEPPNDIFEAQCAIFNSSKVYSGRYYGITITKYTGWGWRTMTPYPYSPTGFTGYNMVAGVPFYFLLAGSGHDSYDKMRVGYITGYPNTRKNTSTFAIPAVLNLDGYHCINFTYTPTTPPGPALKIEGITPGKLEYTSWSEINTVR